MDSSKPPDRQRIAPITTLLLLAPIVAEVLPGATRISTLFVLPTEIGCWGCAALMIRYLVRSRGRRWSSLLLLGIALAIAEEFVIQQTSLAPMVEVDPVHSYGRLFGVNWVYLLWALGYESIWVVILPIQLTELIFPNLRDQPWFGKRGFIIAAIVFMLSCFVAWYSWTQIARPMVFHVPKYQPPLAAIAFALAAILLVIRVSLGTRQAAHAKKGIDRKAPSPWAVGLLTFLLAGAWYSLVLFAYGAFPTLPPAVPIAAGIAWAGFALWLMKRWTLNPAWQDPHRLAAVFGTLVGSMVAGFLTFTSALPIDLYGEALLNITAVLLMIYLTLRVQQRKRL